ncbi:MAG: OPT family oligopeptide transporter [Candidatus Electryonea clarkiae]|nr:OPT family oligopeptide transporter [Candidatus Electryonea clarkiae]MDP8289097.1 OPT family oligopeptide transporter [Candidatus Electryonea clarkiae]
MASGKSKALTPDELELQWFKKHYRGDMPQLTWRAVIMGGFLGAVLSLTNLYIGLKTGWGFGVAITACVLSFSAWKGLRKVGIVKSDMTILENNCMQSTASSAGYSTGGTLVSAIAAYLLVTGEHIPYGLLTAWIFFLAVLGVTLAIPMKRQMINVERLRFPSGIAAAMTLRSLHADTKHSPAIEGPVAEMTDEDFDSETSTEEKVLAEMEDMEGTVSSAEEGEKSARSLFIAGGVASVVAFLRDGFDMLHQVGVMTKEFVLIKYAYPLFGEKAFQYTVGVEGSLLLVAGGALMGIRVATSVMLGSVLCWVVLVPYMYNIGVIEALNYRTMVSWSLWGGASCMVTSGLLAFALQWKSVVRALSGVTTLFSTDKNKSVSEERLLLNKIEVPSSWFLSGALIGGIGVVGIAYGAFGMPIWMGLLAVIMSFFLALVACRVTGETDTTPVGAMGKVTQLMYGAITPKAMRINAPQQTMNVNLMAACITAGVADSASDLLIDLKSGYVLGANPRKQFLAQFSGIFIGTAVTVPVFYLLVPDASALGTDQWPAPAAQVWASVAKLLSHGLGSLHPTAQAALIIGGLLGIMLVALGRILPPKARIWIPSPMGLGLAFTFHFYYGFSMFLGGLLVWMFSKKYPKLDAIYTFPVASGVIAGESLMGIALILTPIVVGMLTGTA